MPHFFISLASGRSKSPGHLSNHTGICLKGAYLHSTAFTACERPESDIDTGILPCKKPEWITLASWSGELEIRVGRQANLVHLENVNTILQVQGTCCGQRALTLDKNACEWLESRVFWKTLKNGNDMPKSKNRAPRSFIITSCNRAFEALRLKLKINKRLDLRTHHLVKSKGHQSHYGSLGHIR